MRNVLLSFVALSTVACGALDAGDGPVSNDATLEARLSPVQEALALQAANQLDFDTLDAVLDRRAAQGIVDGRPFGTLDQLDAVPYVGPHALELLHALGEAHFGGIPAGFEAIPSETLVLWAANELDFETLDEVVGLDRRAAEGIIEARPFASVEALDEAYYVGASAIADLEAHALSVFGSACVHGSLLGPDGLVVHDLNTVLDGASGRYDLIACRGAIPSGGQAWIEDEVHVAIYGFGALDSELDGDDTDGFIVSFDMDSSFSFFGLTVDRGTDLYSPMSLFAADTTVLASVFTGNEGYSGGAIATGHLVAIDSTFQANTASDSGGAISAFDARLVNTDFFDNVVIEGDGAAIDAQGLEMVGGTLLGNQGASIVLFEPHTFDWNGTTTQAILEGVEFGATGANQGAGVHVLTEAQGLTYVFEGVVDVVCGIDGCS